MSTYRSVFVKAMLLERLKNAARRANGRGAPIRLEGEAEGEGEQVEGIEGGEENNSEETPATPTTWQCPNCGGTHDVDDDGEVEERVTHDDGNQACADCSSMCENCDEWVDNDDIRQVRYPRYSPATHRQASHVCNDCVEARNGNYFECADCNDVYHENFSGGSNTDGDRVCSSCGENYFYCEDCGNDYHVDDYGEDGRCTNCSGSSSDLVENYSYEPDTLTFFGKGRHYGVENEVALRRGADLGDQALETLDKLGTDFAYLKEDSSISPNGFEIVTHPATLEIHKQRWDKFLNNPPRYLTANDSCGLHIHIEKKGLSDLEIYKMHALVNSESNRDFIEALARRASERYAAIQSKKVGEMRPFGRLTSGKYEALNLGHEDTVELRIFEGTLKKENFLQALEFADSLVEFAKTGMSSLRDVQGITPFIKFVVGRQKEYPNLAKFCFNYINFESRKRRETFLQLEMPAGDIPPQPGEADNIINPNKTKMSVSLVAIPSNTKPKIAPSESPANGEHENTYNAVTELFGHDPDGIPAWQAVNNILSADGMRHSRHTKIASRIVGEWLAAGKPTDPGSLQQLISRAGHFGAKEKGIVTSLANISSLRSALTSPLYSDKQSYAHFGGNLQLPFASLTSVTPYDLQLSRDSYNPSLHSFEHRSDILSQVKALLSHEGEVSERQLNQLGQYPSKSKMVDAIKTSPVKNDISPYQLLRRIANKVENNPHRYFAYKDALANASKVLGWTTDEVQESIWICMLALIGARQYNIPLDKIQDYLNQDAMGKGWKSHESSFITKLANAYSGAKAKPEVVRRMEEREARTATRNSRPGIVRNSNGPAISNIAANVPQVDGGISDRFRRSLRKVLTEHGIIDKSTGQLRASRVGEPLQLASYDQNLDFVPALQRAVSANHRMFLEHLKTVLSNAGIHPQNIMPAVHDLGNAARVGVVAMGQRMTPEAKTGAAWTGLLGRQPGMIAFTSHPQGQDSIYSFSHNDANAVRSTLDNAGVMNRVLVPSGTTYNVLLYDKGRQKRQNVANALSQLGVTAEEWWGNGEQVGGKKSDMGRGQYRDTINQAERKQFIMSRGSALLLSKLLSVSKDKSKLLRSPLLLSFPSPHEAFRATIDAAPHDDAPKLVYADYLDDQGNQHDADIWRQIAHSSSNDEYNPKGYIIQHKPVGVEGSEEHGRNENNLNAILTNLHRGYSFHSRPIYGHMGLWGAPRDFTYLQSSLPYTEAQGIIGNLSKIDPTGVINKAEPVASIPITTRDWTNLSHMAGSHYLNPNITNKFIPKIVSVYNNDYLVGKPTEIFDAIKHVRSRPLAQQPRMITSIVEAIRRDQQNRINRRALGLE